MNSLRFVCESKLGHTWGTKKQKRTGGTILQTERPTGRSDAEQVIEMFKRDTVCACVCDSFNVQLLYNDISETKHGGKDITRHDKTP